MPVSIVALGWWCPQIVLDTWKGSTPCRACPLGACAQGQRRRGAVVGSGQAGARGVEEMTERSASSYALLVASAKVCNSLVTSDARVWRHRAT